MYLISYIAHIVFVYICVYNIISVRATDEVCPRGPY